MLSMKSKHRCQCYTQSGAFLYGLRRDAPSTERVLLERMLNILSRAAASKNKNPQRLWAESERPEWWPRVTNLQWKNPREHPKDNKETLRKKIELLESELKKRNLMTPELIEEVEIHRGGKKVDLELKSDFEAVISKASGLHFMLDKVHTKMGQARIISDKMASYITETKRCIDIIHERISQMHQQVQEREERKSDLWAAMGVSKTQRQTLADDLVVDAPSPDSGDMDLDFLSDDLAVDISSSVSVPMQSWHLPSSSGPLTADPVDPGTVQRLRIASPHQGLLSPSETFRSVSSMESNQQSSRPQTVDSTSSAGLRRSVSEPVSGSADPENLFALSRSPGSPASVTLSSQPKRTRPLTVEDLLGDGTKVKSRKTQPFTSGLGLGDVIEIDDDDSGDDLGLKVRSPVSVTSRPVSSAAVLETSVGGRQRKEAVRGNQGPRRALSPRPRQHGLFTSARPPTPQEQLPPTPIPISSVMSQSTDKWVRGIYRSMPLDDADGSPLLSDVVEDGGEGGMDLDSVTEILEVSDTPTVTMYTQDTSLDQLAQLTQMTRHLSCDDLSPSVTESVMSDLPSAHTQRTHTPHAPPASTSTATITLIGNRPRSAQGIITSTKERHQLSQATRNRPQLSQATRDRPQPSQATSDRPQLFQLTTSTRRGPEIVRDTAAAGDKPQFVQIHRSFTTPAQIQIRPQPQPQSKSFLEASADKSQSFLPFGAVLRFSGPTGGERQRQVMQTAGGDTVLLNTGDRHVSSGSRGQQVMGVERQQQQQQRQQQGPAQGESSDTAPLGREDSEESLSRAIGGLRSVFM